LKRIIDYNWSISYGLRLTTSIVDRGLILTESKACIRLEIEIEIGLDFDQSKQSSLNLKLVFFFLIGKFQSNLNFIL